MVFGVAYNLNYSILGGSGGEGKSGRIRGCLTSLSTLPRPPPPPLPLLLI